MESLLEALRPFITNYIKNFIENNTTPSKQITINKKNETSKIGLFYIFSEIENDPIIITYVDPKMTIYKEGLRMGQHITKIGDTKVAGKGPEFFANKLLSHKRINITYEEGTETIPYTVSGDGIGKTDIHENDLITVKDEYNQEFVLLVKPDKRNLDNQQNKFSACVIKNVEIKEKGKKKGEEKDSGFISKRAIDERLRTAENKKPTDKLIFTIIKDPNFTLFNHYYRIYGENNNKDFYIFLKYKGSNESFGLDLNKDLVIRYVDAKKLGTSIKKGEKIKELEGSGIFSADAFKDKSGELKKTPGIKYITVQLNKQEKF